MRRHEFDHVIGAAANVTGEDHFVVIGSQAVLGTYPDAPGTLVVSMELDIYPMSSPERADDIDAALGDGSQFHRTHGYYAHGVGPETAVAPAGWRDRLVRVAVEPRVGSNREPVAHCLEIHDLVLAKAVAGRPRDWEFASEALRAGLVGLDELLVRVEGLPVNDDAKERIRLMIAGLGDRRA